MDTRIRMSAAAGLLIGFLGAGCASAPSYQGMDAQELFALGAGEFQEGDWGRAAEVFQRLLFLDPTNPRVGEARVYLARAHFNDGDFLLAANEFTRVLERHPGHELAPEASMGVCQSLAERSPHVQRDQTPTAQAFNACENTLADFAGHPVAAQTRILRDRMEEKLAEKIFIGGDFYFRRKLYHPGIIYFDDVLEEHPQTGSAAQALLRLFQAYTALDWRREAGEARERLLRDFPDSEAAQRIRHGAQTVSGTEN